MGENWLTSLQHGLDTPREPFCYDRDMIEGKCLKCGTYRVGWALLNPRHQTCSKCGTGLEITKDGHKILTGYSPFTGDRYFINPPTNTPSSRDKKEDNRG